MGQLQDRLGSARALTTDADLPEAVDRPTPLRLGVAVSEELSGPKNGQATEASRPPGSRITVALEGRIDAGPCMLDGRRGVLVVMSTPDAPVALLLSVSATAEVIRALEEAVGADAQL